MATEISIVELMKDVERIEKAQRAKKQSGFTTAEFSEQMSIPLSRARAIIKKLITAGKLEPLAVDRISIMNGVTRPVPGFRIVGKGRK